MELKEMKMVNRAAGMPDPKMTDEKWQQYFLVLKLLVKQEKEKMMRQSNSGFIINGQNMDDKVEYKGDTSYSYYCRYINGVLATIRGRNGNAPQVDYCYFIYQISDLLKYEHERLRTRYLPEYQCFEVWLNFDDDLER